jgi:Tol biopolymer transport system component
MDSRSGAGARRLSRPGEACSGPAFRPDGKALAWSSLAAGSSLGNVVVLDLEKGTLVQRTFFSDPEGALHPCFSDDGRTIAFLKVEPHARRIAAVDDRDGARPRELAWHAGIRVDRLSSSVRP